MIAARAEFISRRRLYILFLTTACFGTLIAESFGQGILLPSVGPVNRSMGGAAVAAPLDAISANYWNPASISGLPNSELSFGIELLHADVSTSSFIPGIGGGTTNAESGAIPLPHIGWVQQTPDPSITLGFAAVAAGGFKANFPGSLTNPLFAPPSNAPATPGGFGSVYSEASFFELLPTLSIALNDRLSVGFGPTATIGTLILDPLLFTAPDDADGSGAARYPEGRGTRTAFGGGAQVGVYYIASETVHVGASIKSPQWMEPFRFNTQNELGVPRVAKVKFDLPMVASIGAAYDGIEGWLVALDLRYFDYKNADGFAGHGFNPDGSQRGLGWSSVMSASVGVQHDISDLVIGRLGYSYNQSPIQDGEASFNVASQLMYQHNFNAGFSVILASNVSMNFAYSYLMDNSVTGPVILPTGAIPGSSVTNEVSAHFGSFGVNVRY